VAISADDRDTYQDGLSRSCVPLPAMAVDPQLDAAALLDVSRVFWKIGLRNYSGASE
jgi:ABC-type uncharacterized transport system permease subunit